VESDAERKRARMRREWEREWEREERIEERREGEREGEREERIEEREREGGERDRFLPVVVSSGGVGSSEYGGSALERCGHSTLCYTNPLLLHRLQKGVLVAADPVHVHVHRHHHITHTGWLAGWLGKVDVLVQLVDAAHSLIR
jgi:hypothetical protein